MKTTLNVLLILCVFLKLVIGAEILAVIPSPFYSHQATFRPLWRELAKKGHHVTLLTTDLMEQNNNITQIDLSKTYDIVYIKHNMKNILKEGFSLDSIRIILEFVDDVFDYQFGHPDLAKLIKNKKKFDLLFVEMLIPVWPILSKVFDCPFVGLNTMDSPAFVHGSIGNAIHPALYPFANFGFGKQLSFRERIMSTMFTVTTTFAAGKIFGTFFNGYVRKYFGDELPDITEVQSNLSMIFINANPIFFPVRPVTPTTINLGGGMHIASPKALPKDLQQYLDQSKNGCIYFSFGSTVNSNYLTLETLEIFRKTFEDLAPIRILWKFENDTLPNKPKNVELRKWIPQQDVLRHPNVKVFITQGGLQSMEEAIDSAVPMLGMPFYGDQINNVNKMVEKQFGVKLDVKTIDEESLKRALLDLLNNPIYKKNIDRLSAITKDQPMTGLEKAVWWTEYVLRHGGTEHLRSPSADIPLYQYFFLDIIAFMIVVLIFVFLVFYYLVKLIKFVFRKIFCKKNKIKVN